MTADAVSAGGPVDDRLRRPAVRAGALRAAVVRPGDGRRRRACAEIVAVDGGAEQRIPLVRAPRVQPAIRPRRRDAVRAHRHTRHDRPVVETARQADVGPRDVDGLRFDQRAAVGHARRHLDVFFFAGRDEQRRQRQRQLHVATAAGQRIVGVGVVDRRAVGVVVHAEAAGLEVEAGDRVGAAGHHLRVDRRQVRREQRLVDRVHELRRPAGRAVERRLVAVGLVEAGVELVAVVRGGQRR